MAHFSLNGSRFHTIEDAEGVFSRINRIDLNGIEVSARHPESPAEFDYIHLFGTSPSNERK